MTAAAQLTARRRRQYQRATVAGLVRLIALCDQNGLDFDKFVNEAQEIYRNSRQIHQSPPSCGGRRHENVTNRMLSPAGSARTCVGRMLRHASPQMTRLDAAPRRCDHHRIISPAAA